MKNTLLALALLLPFAPSAQIRLTEVAPTNTGQLTDEDGDRPDWLEIQNQGLSLLSLSGWGLSDGGASTRWPLPALDLAPGERLLVFASGKNRSHSPVPPPVNHWETAVNEGDDWRYLVGTANPPADWAELGFDDSAWPSGPGGFGYGDGDDATQLPDGTLACYLRRTFQAADTAQLARAILSMDYDDGFAAYLNGSPIARSSNLPTGPLQFDTPATPDHEAALYSGGTPESFPLDAALFQQLLRPGTNVLAIEIHNVGSASSDLSARPWLHLGIASTKQFFGQNPDWFDPGPGGGGTGGQNLHTDFKLRFFEKIKLYDAAGKIADSLTIKRLEPGHSQMRLNDDGQWCVTAAPTPRLPNGTDCLSDYAAAPGFALAPGFYAGAQTLALTGGAGIRYTTDGAAPTETSALYTAPIAVPKTTVVRARRFEQFRLPSQTLTSTYFIDDPTALSAVSVCIEPSEFDGVYTAHNQTGRVSVEYFDQNRQRQLAQDAAGYVVGNWSVDFPQKSLQFDADEEWGSAGEFEYPIFAPDKPIQHLRSWRIRNEDDDFNLARMRDRIVNELAATTHAGRASYRNVATFINGEYWGHYVARERLDNYWCRDNLGADPDSVNMVKTHWGLGNYLAEYGTIDDFYAMSDFVQNNDMAAAANFQQAAQLLDLENFTDYFATEVYVASTDWLQDYFNNVRLFKVKKNAPWKFLLWDVSYSSGAGSGCTSCDVLGSTLANPFGSRYGKMFSSLLKNPEYRRGFINRFADLMNTEFLPARAHALIQANAAELAPEIARHNDRWGTGDLASWTNSVQALRDFYAQRPANQRQHIVDNFQLDQEVGITLAANPPGAGVIRISTITPENLPWTGIYFHGNPVTLTAIPNPGYTFTGWSPSAYIANLSEKTFTADVAAATQFTANFTGSPQPTALTISELNYHSAPTADAGDWFELANYGAVPLDLSGYALRDEEWYHRLALPLGTVLPPGARLVFFENEAKFEAQHPGLAAKIGPTGFGLGNGSDALHLYDRAGVLLRSVAYQDESPWPTEADGDGYTLENVDFTKNLSDAAAWAKGCLGGSPGTAPPPGCIITSGTEDVPLPLGLSRVLVFPNPASSQLTVRLPAGQQAALRLSDALGRIVFSEKNATGERHLDVGRLAPGVYALEVLDEQGRRQTAWVVVGGER